MLRLVYWLTNFRRDKYYCPVCKKKVAKFIPLPDYYANNLKKHGYCHSFDDVETLNYSAYSCPHCLSSDRDRLCALYIENYLIYERPKSSLFIIEIAPSKPLSEFVRQQDNVSLRTADLMMQGVDDLIDITDMKYYQDHTFDFFICSHVLEHVPDDMKALRELYRILKPGGRGILMVPIVLSLEEIDEDPGENEVTERWRRFGQDDHVRLYSKQGYIDRVKRSGFQVHELGVSFFGKTNFITTGISPSSVLYVVEKNSA